MNDVVLYSSGEKRVNRIVNPRAKGSSPIRMDISGETLRRLSPFSASPSGSNDRADQAVAPRAAAISTVRKVGKEMVKPSDSSFEKVVSCCVLLLGVAFHFLTPYWNGFIQQSAYHPRSHMSSRYGRTFIICPKEHSA